jgi:hypothetical protein
MDLAKNFSDLINFIVEFIEENFLLIITGAAIIIIYLIIWISTKL